MSFQLWFTFIIVTAQITLTPNSNTTFFPHLLLTSSLFSSLKNKTTARLAFSELIFLEFSTVFPYCFPLTYVLDLGSLGGIQRACELKWPDTQTHLILTIFNWNLALLLSKGNIHETTTVAVNFSSWKSSIFISYQVFPYHTTISSCRSQKTALSPSLLPDPLLDLVI